MFSSCIWTPFIAKLILSEPFRKVYWIAILCGFTGVIFVSQPDFIFGYIAIPFLSGNSDSDTDDDGKASPGSMKYFLAALVCVFGAIAAAFVYAIIRKTGGLVHYQVLVFYYGVVGSMLIFNFLSLILI